MLSSIFYPKYFIYFGILLVFLNFVTPLNFPKACPAHLDICFVGFTMSSFDSKTKLEAFMGIPYAKAPIGDLRFKRPQPYEFDVNCTIFIAMTDRPECMQYNFHYEDQPHGSEDCLFLNLYRPKGYFYKAEKKVKRSELVQLIYRYLSVHIIIACSHRICG